jgi:hypothetical protein
MNKKEKKVALSKKGKPSVPDVKKLPPEVKDQKIELFTKQSDELASQEALKRRQRQKQKIEFLGGGVIVIEDYVANVITKHITKFHKAWFYKLADVYKVDRKLMDVYVKPEFVRQFIIQFVYGRFPYLLLRTLRSRNRKLHGKNCKLFQHLNPNASQQLDDVIKQVSDVMDISESPLAFKMKYSEMYKIHFQVELFQ